MDAPRLVVYPELWRRSVAQHPQDWKAQFRCLCAHVRTYRRSHGRLVDALPDGERLFLQALGEGDPEELIALILESTRHLPPHTSPLAPLDPADPLVPKLNGHKMLFDA
jgi:hypothetical protein